MAWTKNIGLGFRALFAKRHVERELDEELDAFIEAAVADKQRNGMSPADARRAVLVETGSLNSVKHQIWTSRWE